MLDWRTIMNSVLKEDINEIIHLSYLNWGIFKNKTFLISGGTGFLGSLLVKSLLHANDVLNTNITIFVIIRNQSKYASVFKEFLNRDDLRPIICDFEIDDVSINESIDYIIHTASITTSKIIIEKPVDVIMTSLNGTKKLLDLARKNKGCKFLYLSSMEMYGNVNRDGWVSERDLGYIDLDNIRNVYPESKRLCEMLCKSYKQQYSVKVYVARLAQTFGAGVSKSDNRIFAQFARSVINKSNIVLHTEGKSEGNYVYSVDAVGALFLLLQKGLKGESYNVVNEKNHMTIYEMAQLVATEVSPTPLKVIIDIPSSQQTLGYAPDVRLKLSSKKLEKLGWKIGYNLTDSYQRLITSYMCQNNR